MNAKNYDETQAGRFAAVLCIALECSNDARRLAEMAIRVHFMKGELFEDVLVTLEEGWCGLMGETESAVGVLQSLDAGFTTYISGNARLYYTGEERAKLKGYRAEIRRVLKKAQKAVKSANEKWEKAKCGERVVFKARIQR